MQNYNPYESWDDFVYEHNEVAQMTPEHIVAFDEWIAGQTEKPKESDVQGWLDVNVKPKSPFRWGTITKLINISTLRVIQNEFKEKFGDAVTLKRPGFGLPLNYLPDYSSRFPVIFGDSEYGWRAATLLVREVCMLKLINELSDKPEWWRKVKDDEIAAKWKKEALEMDWGAIQRWGDFTPAMADACIAELRGKAEIYEETGLMPVFDYSACVIKSDSLLTDELVQSLKDAVKPLEDVPEDRKDWHPHSDGKVLDIVHPSLWPLVYGRSRILTDRTIGVDDALSSCGVGQLLPQPSDREQQGESRGYGWRLPEKMFSLSGKFQWLPCEVDIDPGTGSAKIASYINNVHPVEQAALYPVIESFIQKSLPAWDVVYRWPSELQVQRLSTETAELECLVEDICSSDQCEPAHRPIEADENPREDNERYEDGYEESERNRRDLAWFAATHTAQVPDADPEAIESKFQASDVKQSGFFDDAKRIQVIVKLANIHLTPEKPTYDGGSWHTEGQLNEHIVATALYYYDSDNITDCMLDFRTPANEEDLGMELSHEQGDTWAIERTFAINADYDTLQDVGSVLTRPGRALFFPNVLQHHVSPFGLADPSRPGHRKILALFLVDPAIPVISTANVPPQQRHWWEKEIGGMGRKMGKLPPEIKEMVIDGVDWPIGEEQAKLDRLELMAERTSLQGDADDRIRRVQWSFCEH